MLISGSCSLIAMCDVQIGQACDTVHVDLLHSISHKSNNYFYLRKYSFAILKTYVS